MRISRARVGIASLVLLAFAAGVSALMARPPNADTFPCTQYNCPAQPPVCVYPYVGTGFCTQGKTGAHGGFAQNADCCCCTGDSQGRWFHGG